MRTFLLTFITLLQFALNAQETTIYHGIPEGYEDIITDTDYQKLVNYAITAVGKHYDVESVKDGTIILQDNHDHSFNLHNLIEICASVDKSEWKTIITDHFDRLIDSMELQNAMDLTDYKSVKQYLTLRIYPKAYVDNNMGLQRCIARTDLEGTYTVLMFDLPHAFSSVNHDLPEIWKKSKEELFRVATDNVNKIEIVKVTEIVQPDGMQFELHLMEEENFAGVYALDLQKNSPEFVGELGSIVSIPNAGFAIIYKIDPKNPAEFADYIRITHSLNQESYTGHSKGVTPDYFWYYKGKFTKVGVREQPDGEFYIVPPDGLTKLTDGKKQASKKQR
jgi:hypothetical protein